MQSDKKLTVYAYAKNENERYTAFSEVFDVLARPKPDDYVYTETEIKTWESLDERIKKLEQGGGGGSGAAGEDGGYYIPNVSQVDETTVKMSFTASKDDMTPVPDQQITLPKGPKGNDGYTPKKGVDYYTETEKQEMVTAVIAALPKYNGEVEPV